MIQQINHYLLKNLYHYRRRRLIQNQAVVYSTLPSSCASPTVNSGNKSPPSLSPINPVPSTSSTINSDDRSDSTVNNDNILAPPLSPINSAQNTNV
ncbi:hypothetical protein BDF20DRAFT_579085 [Mycotypha africana]|uniref:uncharacterized protein n=1 Tax=Mycotypha africana TaxID=64632 RepID=UPI002300E064|nr:uncharacterized protein BDF20DRAFT_579085 [Mycotypha africana]KAI8977640.1 hypothetical protein BDF20DRAFT_579085 [Mycotypha africana]